MEIYLEEISIKEVFNGYVNDDEEGVFGYGGKLNIRPKYQREFKYNDKEQKSVIDSVIKGYPLNVMYWVIKNDGTFELLDGQQRTLSICRYLDNSFSIELDGRPKQYNNLLSEDKEKILSYRLMVYKCKGSDKEILEWFRTINISGKKLFEQEIRNAVYSGLWTNELKKWFSKTNCPAYKLGSNYLNGNTIDQDYLETVLSWLSDKDKIKDIDSYMAVHQNDTNINTQVLYFQSVINWIQALFPKYRREMKGIEWGFYYNRYRNLNFDPNLLEKKFCELIEDDDVTSVKGIYEYLLDSDQKHLSLRKFDEKEKRRKFEDQKGICVSCQKHCTFEQMEGDHIIPWSKGGHTIYNNLQMLCKKCNGQKSSR